MDTVGRAFHFTTHHMPEYYASENAFRLYEPVLIQAIISIPHPISFVSKNQARCAATDAARCRDTIASWKVNRWESPISKAAARLSELRVWEFDDRVYIGTAHARKEFNSMLAFCDVHGESPNLKCINHYYLDEIHFPAPEIPPPSPPKKPVEELPLRPLLFPRVFEFKDIHIPAAHPRMTSITEAEEAQPDLAKIIDDIDKGILVGQQTFPDIYEDEILRLIAGRLNIGMVKKDSTIILF
jgi:hypothetical protein